MRARALPLAGFAGLLLAGCSPLYAVRAAWGHLGFVSRARPIARLAADPRTGPGRREKLRLVADAREYAFRELGLERSRDYSSVSSVAGPFVSWVVMASPKTRLEPREWWFPFIGRVPYKGYFSEKAARAEAGRLERQGLDARVGGVAGYNTPLPIADPLSEPELDRPPGELAGLILHELAHGTVFFKGRMDFNESFATFVEEEAGADFIAARYGPDSPELAELRDSQERDRERAGRMERLRRDLSALYASDADDGAKLAAREPVFAQAREDLRAILGSDPGALNNADVAAFRLYRRGLADFRELRERLGRSWKATVEAVRSLDRRRPFEDLKARLERLRPAGT